MNQAMGKNCAGGLPRQHGQWLLHSNRMNDIEYVDVVIFENVHLDVISQVGLLAMAQDGDAQRLPFFADTIDPARFGAEKFVVAALIATVLYLDLRPREYVGQ